jgi:hypothetical protein
MSEAARWNLVVSRNTDVALRALLATRGRRRGDLSRFVEEAVNREIIRYTMSDVRSRNAGLDANEMARLIDNELCDTRELFWPARGAKPPGDSL